MNLQWNGAWVYKDPPLFETLALLTTRFTSAPSAISSARSSRVPEIKLFYTSVETCATEDRHAGFREDQMPHWRWYYTHWEKSPSYQNKSTFVVWWLSRQNRTVTVHYLSSHFSLFVIILLGLSFSRQCPLHPATVKARVRSRNEIIIIYIYLWPFLWRNI